MLPVPEYNRWGLYSQTIFILVCWGWWWIMYTPPGLAIAALGAAAVIMTVRANYYTRTEQVIWIIIAFVLFGAEANSIYEDRVKNDKTEREAIQRQQAEFEGVLTQSQKQFEATMRDSEAILGQTRTINELSKENLNTMTGGETFAYVDFVDSYGDYGDIVKVGDEPLYGVKLRIQAIYTPTYKDSSGKTYPIGAFSDMRVMQLHDLPIGPYGGMYAGINQDEVAIPNLPPERRAFRHDDDPMKIIVTFNARNGSWREFIWIRRMPQNNHNSPAFLEAIRVFRTIHGKGKMIFEKIPENFPQELMNNSRYFIAQ